ncbi:MAG: hypothetical protein EOP87_21575 [Verrucomicrobiaceae bacterium]|nr:MAG: hypothetical protein EOP87_21575 [Verrucomicrobiaceae bacterium]
MLVLLFLTSIALTAVTVGLSGCNSVIIRSLLPIFGLPALLWTLLMMMTFGARFAGGSLADFCSLADPDTRIAVAAYVLCISYGGLSMLSLGASLIAPAAENHSIWRRLAALVAMVVLIPLNYFGILDDGLHAMVLFIIAGPAIVIALSESAPLVSSVCEPFLKRGPLGKLVGLFFYPVWASGVLFSVLLGVLGVVALLAHPAVRNNTYSVWNNEMITIMLALLGSLFFPAVWQTFFFRGDGQRLANYLLILVGSYVMLGILAMLADAMNNPDFIWFFAWNPLTFIILTSEGKAPDSFYLAWVCAVDGLLALMLVTHALMIFRKSATVMDETEATLHSD